MKELILSDVLEQAAKEKRMQLSMANRMKRPETNGKLRIITDRKYDKYYLRTEKGDACGRYLKKDEIDIAKNIAQNSYNEEVINLLEKQIAGIERLQKICDNKSVESIYDSLGQKKQKLVTPIVPTNKEYIERWLAKRSDTKNTWPIKREHYTDNGEIVRSKSEELIANKLFSLGIPYKYEEAVHIGNEIKFPDFTILNINTREEIYFEHFGFMDDIDYCNKTIDTIKKYQLNGLKMGINFFCTFETSNTPINMQIFESILKSNNIIPQN